MISRAPEGASQEQASFTRGSRTRLVGVATFGVTLLAALLLFAFTSWLEGVSYAWQHGLYLWAARLDTGSALNTLSNAAEVVAAVLAIAITVVAIVVELAANRYTHRITQLFVREPFNALVMGFFVVTAIQCLWVSASLSDAPADDAVIPYAGVLTAMGMVTGSLLLLLPYFAYVFAFLNPINVVRRLARHAYRAVERASRRALPQMRAEAIEGVEELEDVALNAMEHKDRAITMACITALAEILVEYQRLCRDLPDEWFRIEGSLLHDADFVSMSPMLVDEIQEQRTWFEIKVLRQYHALFTESLNRMRDVSYLIALNTRKIANLGRQDGDDLFDVSVRFFNSYLRAAINASDGRTAYYVLHQYRILAESKLTATGGARAIRIAQHLRFYGQLAFTQKMPFLLEAVAYDLSLVVEKAVPEEHPATDALLDVFLQVDRESDSVEQETRLLGVRRAQVQLATFLLVRGDTKRARSVFDDMADEKAERLISIREELLAEVEPLYWELTDRGVNFAYLPPERRARVAEFFEWFGDRLD